MRDTQAAGGDGLQAELKADFNEESALPAGMPSIGREPATAEERAAYYQTPEFRQRLLEHLHRAKMRR